MSEFRTKISEMERVASEEQKILKVLDSIECEICSVYNALSYDVRNRESLGQSLKKLANNVNEHEHNLESMRLVLINVKNNYEKTEQYICENINNPSVTSEALSENTFWNTFWSEYGFGGLLAGSGYINDIYKLAKDVKDGKSWKSANDVYDIVSRTAKEYRNYKKIGNVVGTKTAAKWWAKSMIGLKPLGKASTAKNPITRFCNNLTNKTSPFHAQIKDTVDNFKGANGVGKAVASWASVALDGVTNWFDNKEEQKESNGTMSDERVWAETITETVVGTVLTHGSNIVVGAAVTTALGSVAAPGIVVVAASGAIIAAVNAGVKTLTGKTTTEWISDAILDTGEAVGKAVGNLGREVGKFGESIGNWFNKLSFA